VAPLLHLNVFSDNRAELNVTGTPAGWLLLGGMLVGAGVAAGWFLRGRRDDSRGAVSTPALPPAAAPGGDAP